MNYSTTATSNFDGFVSNIGPTPLGTWLGKAWQRVVTRAPAAPLPSNREREAAELRSYALSVRRTDPRFADDLFAAADRHEAPGA